MSDTFEKIQTARERTLEVVVTGHNLSGMTSLTADLARKLTAVGANVTIDQSCIGGEILDFTNSGKTFENLNGVNITLKNIRVPKGEIGHDSGFTDDDSSIDVIRFANGETYNFDTDKLIGMPQILTMTGTSRSTVERWIREGTFPKAHFKFGKGCRRWVARLIMEHVVRTGGFGQHEEPASQNI